MLAALITYLLLSGSGAGPTIESIKAAEKAVEQIVVDEARRDAAVGTLEEMRDVVLEFNKRKTDTFKDIEKAGRSRDTTTADFKAMIEPERERILELQDRFLKLHSELKTHLTEEEWGRMYEKLDED